MNTTDVMNLLEANQDPRGIANWEERGPPSPELSSYGIGLSRLRKLARQIGRSRDLALALWQTDCYDARVIGLLIDDPKQITREQAEAQVEQVHHGMLSHVFSSCDATLAKAPFVVELAVDWVRGDDPERQRCGYGLMYEISKDKRKRAPDDDFFLEQIRHIDATEADSPPEVRLAMGTALMGIGKRNRLLNAEALRVAQKMGPLPATPGCDPFEPVKHLTSDYLKKKLGL